MRCRAAALFSVISCLAYAVIIDRIAIIVGNRIVKDSDIRRDIRVTSFLNGETPNFSNASRKAAANRLIDQVFIRNEIEEGDYPTATLQEADEQLSELEKQKFHTRAAFEAALRRDHLTELDLRTYFQWQLTVLRFIDFRFKPAVLISDDQIDAYYREHRAALEREHPGHATLEDVSAEIRDTITAEKVNQLFFSWLDEQRKKSKIQFLEESLE